MEQQQGTSQRSILIAGLGLIVSLALFSFAFYYYDGVTLVSDLVDSVLNPPAAATPSRSAEATGSLVLPEQMDEDFALRLWQEQVDSQEMIGRLADGKIKSLRITKVTTGSAEATLVVTAMDREAGKLGGVIGLRRFNKNWYVAFASANRGNRYTPRPSTHPSLDEVDVQLLNTIIDQQDASQPVLDEYLAGTVHEVVIKDVVKGPRTVTIEVEMYEDHGEGYAKIVLIQHDNGGTPQWFIARFIKTGDLLK